MLENPFDSTRKLNPSSAHRVGVAALAVFGVSVMLPRLAFCAEDKATAKTHYEIGTRLYEVREYGKALEEYKAAYVAKPDPAFLFNIGQCLRKLDRNPEAVDFFQQYLRKTPPDDPNRAQAEARIRNIQAGLSSAYDPFDHPTSLKPASPPPQAAAVAAPSAPPIVQSPPAPQSHAKTPAALPPPVPIVPPETPTTGGGITAARRWGSPFVDTTAETTSTGGGITVGKYVVSSAGLTVTDTSTRLVWQRDGAGSRPNCRKDPYCKLDEAKAYCAGLNLDGSGWRLPTRYELKSIVDDTVAKPPTINQTAFPSTPAEWFWTSSPYAGSSGLAWCIYFYSGSSGYNGVGVVHRVRCVR